MGACCAQRDQKFPQSSNDLTQLEKIILNQSQKEELNVNPLDINYQKNYQEFKEEGKQTKLEESKSNNSQKQVKKQPHEVKGSSKVGKTSLINSIKGIEFLPNYIPTQETQKILQEIKSNERQESVQVSFYDMPNWNYMHNDVFQIVNNQYPNDIQCEGVVLMYAVDDNDSFNMVLQMTMDPILQNKQVLVIENKIDLEEYRQTPPAQEAQDLLGVSDFASISVAKKINLDKLFKDYLEKIIFK